MGAGSCLAAGAALGHPAPHRIPLTRPSAHPPPLTPPAHPPPAPATAPSRPTPITQQTQRMCTASCLAAGLCTHPYPIACVAPCPPPAPSTSAQGTRARPWPQVPAAGLRRGGQPPMAMPRPKARRRLWSHPRPAHARPGRLTWPLLALGHVDELLDVVLGLAHRHHALWPQVPEAGRRRPARRHLRR